MTGRTAARPLPAPDRVIDAVRAGALRAERWRACRWWCMLALLVAGVFVLAPA